MFFKTKAVLSEEDVQQGMKSVILDGIASTAMGTFTGGIFLTAYALKLGASNYLIGLLAAVGPLMSLIQIPSIYLVEKIKNRKSIVVTTSLISRSFWLLVAAIPFIFSAKAGINILFFGMALYSLFGAVAGTAWGPWLRDLLPQDRLGSFFSKRMVFSTVMGIVLSMLCAVYLDQWKKFFPRQEIAGYSILFVMGFIAGIIGVYFLYTIPEPRMAVSKAKIRFWRLLTLPFKDENFRKLMAFLGAWTFSVNLAAPFFTVYLIKRLDLEMSLIIGLSILSQIVHLIFLRIWGRFTDRFTNKSVLSVSAPLYLVCIFMWTFTTLPDKYFLTIPLLILIYIFMGISTAGINIAAGNIGFKLSPKGEATSFLTVSNFINSLSASLAPIIGGKLADVVTDYELSWTLQWKGPNGLLSFQTLNFQSWDFFFAVAFLVGIYSLHRLSLVKEVGEVTEKIVFDELISETRKEIRNFTTVAGARQMVNFPFTAFRYIKTAGRSGWRAFNGKKKK
ncbi:MAG: MFS transporter [Candidatus Omnitrophota bacterium]